MNKQQLRDTQRSLLRWVETCKMETVHLDKRMEILMLALAAMCEALASEEPKVVELEVLDVK